MHLVKSAKIYAQNTLLPLFQKWPGEHILTSGLIEPYQRSAGVPRHPANYLIGLSYNDQTDDRTDDQTNLEPGVPVHPDPAHNTLRLQ